MKEEWSNTSSAKGANQTSLMKGQWLRELGLFSLGMALCVSVWNHRITISRLHSNSLTS